MDWTLWTRKELALIAAILTLACATAFLSIKLTRPKPFANAALSQQWHCTTTALILSVCHRKRG